jgi:hypothetical protein
LGGWKPRFIRDLTNIAGSLKVSLVLSNVFAVSRNFIYLLTFNSLHSMQSYTFRGSNQNLSEYILITSL